MSATQLPSPHSTLSQSLSELSECASKINSSNIESGHYTIALQEFAAKAIEIGSSINHSMGEINIGPPRVLSDILNLPRVIFPQKKGIKRKVITTESVMLTEKEMIAKLAESEKAKTLKMQKKGSATIKVLTSKC